jgi:hypothetical protein
LKKDFNESIELFELLLSEQKDSSFRNPSSCSSCSCPSRRIRSSDILRAVRAGAVRAEGYDLQISFKLFELSLSEQKEKIF